MIVSILFSIAAMVYSQKYWGENKPNEKSERKMYESFYEALGELKKREVLCMGIIESFWQAVFNIFLFAWTPILMISSPTGINVGFIFTCFVMTMIVGTKTYEIFNIYLKCESYFSIALSLLFEAVMFYLITVIDHFILRFIFLACINGVTGYFQPLNSIIKSNILVEKHRATLMNIFRIPLNLYVIIVLVSLKYMAPLSVKNI